MPSGRLVCRRVDLMAASMRAPLALCGWLTILLPYEAWEKLDQIVWFEFNEHLVTLG